MGKHLGIMGFLILSINTKYMEVSCGIKVGVSINGIIIVESMGIQW